MTDDAHMAMNNRSRKASKAAVTVLLLEDQGLLRDLVAERLEASGFWVLRAATLDEAVLKAGNKPTAALLDISLKGVDTDTLGLEAAGLIKKVSPDTLCMVLTDAGEGALPQLVRRAMLAPDESRFDGFALKRPGVEHLLEALTHLLNDGYYMEPSLAKHHWVDSSTVLTDDEIAVVRELQNGLTQTQIAPKLHFSPEKVKRHVSSAKRRLGVNTPAALVREAEKQGYLRTDESVVGS